MGLVISNSERSCEQIIRLLFNRLSRETNFLVCGRVFISKEIIIFAPENKNSHHEVRTPRLILSSIIRRAGSYPIMKKIFTSSLLLALCLAAGANEPKQLTVFETDIKDPQFGDMPLLGLTLSPNGKFIAGVVGEAQGVFIANTETCEVKYFVPGMDGTSAEDAAEMELRGVDNNGVAIGFGAGTVLYAFEDNSISIIPKPEGSQYVIGEDITADGSEYLGTAVYGSGLEAGVSKVGVFRMKDDEEWTMLPRPTDEDFDYLGMSQRGTSANFISADGKIIFGTVGSFTLPVGWMMNDMGAYECDFYGKRYLKTEREEDLNDPEKPFFGMGAMYYAMSNNGRHMMTIGAINLGETNKPEDRILASVPVSYDIVTKTITVYDEDQKVNKYGYPMYPTGVADDGSFVGTFGQPFTGSSGSYIMKAGETQSQTLSQAFPDFGAVLGEADSFGFVVPTGYSADGKYISGYAWYSTDFNDDSPAYYVTWAIDTTAPAGVESVKISEPIPVAVGIYDIKGQRLEKMTKGLNIVRMSDGTSRKVMVK